MTASQFFSNAKSTLGAKTRGRVKGVRKSTKIAKWVKYSYRLIYLDGSKKYLSFNIAQLEGQTIKDTVAYLVRQFKELVTGDTNVASVKLITVDGEKQDILVTF